MGNILNIGGNKLVVGLDRLVIGLPYPAKPKVDVTKPMSQEQLKDVQSHLEARDVFIKEMHHIQYMMATGLHKPPKPLINGDLKRYIQLADCDGGVLCIFTLGFSYGTGVINFECNPAKLTNDHCYEIGALIGILFEDHYQELYSRAVVAHAEFYIDVHGEELSSLVLIGEGRSKTEIYKGTSYYGNRRSPKVATMYDKAKEKKISGALVRIEIRINRRDILFSDLVEQDTFNPWASVFVVNKSELQAASKQWKLPHLAEQIIEHGIHDAVSNKHARKSILTYLRKRSVPWWKPEQFWATHRKLLSDFKPGLSCMFD